jgi:hypothetical protein
MLRALSFRPLASFLVIVSLAGCAASYPGRIAVIDTDDGINQLSADSAPQQTVVNGWTARDYLKLVAEQNTEHSFLNYATLLLLLLITIQLIRLNRRIGTIDKGLSRDSAHANPPPTGPPRP